MFSAVLNRVRIDLALHTASPLLIKSGGRGADPSRPDMEFTRTRNANGQPTVFIPGSSLKGVVRSHAERLIRSEPSAEPACDPTDRESCSRRLGRRRDLGSAERYRSVCPACRLFGSTLVASRILFTDLMPIEEGPEAVATETRTSVGIDRLLGSAARGALFDFEVAPTGTIFGGDLVLENFEAWQLGLVAAALADLDAGFLRLGFGSSRGLGRVSVKVDRMVIEQRRAVSAAFRGIGELVEAAERASYGLSARDRIEVLPMPDAVPGDRLFERWVIEGAIHIDRVLQASQTAQLPRRPNQPQRSPSA